MQNFSDSSAVKLAIDMQDFARFEIKEDFHANFHIWLSSHTLEKSSIIFIFQDIFSNTSLPLNIFIDT